MTAGTETGAVARYRRKPVEVEAIQWTGGNVDEMQEFTGHRADNEDEVFQSFPNIDDGAQLAVLWTERSRRYCELPVGSWAIRESDGSGFYPCAGDVFASTYEPADEPSAALDRDRLVDLIGKRTAMYGFAAEDLADAILAIIGSEDGEAEHARQLIAHAEAADAGYRLAAVKVAVYEFLHGHQGREVPAMALDLAVSLKKIIDGSEEADDA